MYGHRRMILLAGIIAALVQLAVPPHLVWGRFVLGGGIEVTRRFPVWQLPPDVIRLTDAERSSRDDGSHIVTEGHRIAGAALAVQLAATALLVGLALLVLPGAKPRAETFVDSSPAPSAVDTEL